VQKPNIETKHGILTLPAFMPDATYGSVKSVSFQDVDKTGTEAIVTTTLHIEQKIGSLYIKEFGGLHKFFGWNKPILTDSGGWQVFSLIQSKQDKGKNKISDLGCSFVNPDTGEHSLLTPESSQVIQNNLSADIVTVLDNPILGDASYAQRKESIRINTLWAKRSKKEFDRLNIDNKERPLIGCVIQGANDNELRKISANDLLELDFDIYNFGGVPMQTQVTWLTESKKGFYHEMLEYVSGLVPNTKYKYAMGVGQPDDIAFCVDVGWDLFDTVLPTRNARHGFLYVSEGQGETTKSYKNLSYDNLHIKTEKYKFDNKPIDENCSCEACKTVSRAYVRHLIRIGEASGLRLATIHNLQFYADWMKKIRTNLVSVL